MINFIKQMVLIFTLILLIHIYAVAELPEIPTYWSNQTFVPFYMMNFEASYTVHYVNIQEKNINPETNAMEVEVIDSYVPNFDTPKIRWEGEIIKDSQGKTRMSLTKFDFNIVGIQDDKITSITHYMNSDVSLSLNHTEKIARRSSMNHAPIMLEWPFWVPSLSNTEKYLILIVKNWEYDWEMISNTPGEGAVFNIRNDERNYLAKLVFDVNNYLVEFDENTSQMRKNRKFNYVKTANGLIITDIVYSRYYNRNNKFDGPMETFEFHAYPYIEQTQNINAYDQFPSIPEDYEIMDTIDKYAIDRNGNRHELKSRYGAF